MSFGFENGNARRSPYDNQRVARSKPKFEESKFQMCLIDSSTVISNYRYSYTVQPAIVSATSPFDVVVRSGEPTYLAYSMSELGNTNTFAAYGLDYSAIPPFTPVAIPDGTPVICMGCARDDGTFFYLIINTQAISGTC